MKRILLASLSLVLCFSLNLEGTYVFAADAWIGAYEAQEREAGEKKMAQEVGMPWPTVMFKADGTFDWQIDEKGMGTYEVKGTSVTLKFTEVNGGVPQKHFAQPVDFTFDDNFQVLVFPGGEERFIKKQ